MKKYFLSIITISIAVANVYAGEGFIGKFKGTENVEISGCGDSSFIERSINLWEVTNTSTGENSFMGKIETRAGFSTSKGTITDNKAKGTVRGMNNRGVSWSGVFTSEIDGDDYTLIVTGIIPSSGCNFRSHIQATRQ